MFPIVKKRVLNETVTLMEIEAPLVARKALPGQFIIFRIDEEGERIPLTIAGYDREKGTVTIIFQKVGYTTMKLDTLNEGDALLDFVGRWVNRAIPRASSARRSSAAVWAWRLPIRRQRRCTRRAARWT